jgi:hypothetical protein
VEGCHDVARVTTYTYSDLDQSHSIDNCWNCEAFYDLDRRSSTIVTKISSTGRDRTVYQ